MFANSAVSQGSRSKTGRFPNRSPRAWRPNSARNPLPAVSSPKSSGRHPLQHCDRPSSASIQHEYLLISAAGVWLMRPPPPPAAGPTGIARDASRSAVAGVRYCDRGNGAQPRGYFPCVVEPTHMGIAGGEIAIRLWESGIFLDREE